MKGIPGNEEAVIGGDMNGHVGSERREYKRVHGWYRFGERIEAGEKVLDFTSLYELANSQYIF